jgi:transcriptional regulator with XRE-family HTH domain
MVFTGELGMKTSAKTDRQGPRAKQAAEQDEGAHLKIGTKLRVARKARRLSMRELADRVGCSESLISKIEGDHVTPSLPMLHKIAKELDTSIGKMFEANPDGDFVARKGKRPILSLEAIGREAGKGIQLEGIAINGEFLYGSIHIVDPGGSSGGFIQHVGEEVGYVLEGTIEITVGTKAHLLEEGDSIFFPSELPHGYRNPGSKVARILWINTPPTF